MPNLRPISDNNPFVELWSATKLLDLSARLVASPDLQSAVETVLAAALSLRGADFGIVQLFNDEERALEIAAHRGFDPEFLKAFRRVSAEDTVTCGRALRERRTVSIFDLEAEDWNVPHRAVVERAGYRAVQSTPLIAASGELVGVLSTFFRKPHRPSLIETQMIELYAQEAAEIIIRSRNEASLRRSDERQRLLIRELNHRFKNMLMVIEAISRQTAKSAASPEDFADALAGRLRAIGRAQALLTQSGGRETDLLTLIREQLLLSTQEDRIACNGPEVPLQARDALDLGLLLHELGTNARKYGALSNDSGCISVKWSLLPGDKPQVLSLHWTERGGPPVRTPTGTGFGSKLIRHLSNSGGGDAQIRFDPDGVACSFRIVLHSASDSESASPAAPHPMSRFDPAI